MRKIISLDYPVVQGLKCQAQIGKIAFYVFDGVNAYKQGEEFLRIRIEEDKKGCKNDK